MKGLSLAGSKRPGVHQGVEGVARVAAGDLRPGKRLADKPAGRLVAEHLADGAVESGLERVAAPSHLAAKRGGVERPERRLAAVGQKATSGDEVIPRRALGDRVWTRRSCCRPSRRSSPRRPSRSPGAKNRPCGSEEPVEVVADDARLDPDPPPLVTSSDTIRFRCRPASTTIPPPTTWPASDVPAARGTSGTRWAAANRTSSRHVGLGLRAGPPPAAAPDTPRRRSNRSPARRHRAAVRPQAGRRGHGGRRVAEATA